MSSAVPAKLSHRYVVWANGRTVEGDALTILKDIQNHARDDSDVRRRTSEEYADVLISDAAYFFPDREVPYFLRDREYGSKYEQALEYLAAMPSSGVRILKMS